MKHSVKLSANSPARAAFTMDGPYMEPWIRAGEVVPLVFRLPVPGECGLFRLGRETLVRQYCEDSFGGVYLLAANRACAALDRCVRPGEGDIVCLGTLLLERQPPLPLGGR